MMSFGIGMGALVGTFALAVFPGGQRGNLLLWMGLISGVSPVLMAASMSMAPAIVSSILMGSSQAMFMALTAILLQSVVPDEVRGGYEPLSMAAGGIMASRTWRSARWRRHGRARCCSSCRRCVRLIVC